MRTTLLAALLLCSAAHGQDPMLIPLGGQVNYIDGDTTTEVPWTTNGIWYGRLQYWDADIPEINGDINVQSGEEGGWLTFHMATGGIDGMEGFFDFSSTGRKYELYPPISASMAGTDVFLDGHPMAIYEPLWLEPGTHRLSWERDSGGSTGIILATRVPEPGAWVMMLAGVLGVGLWRTIRV